MSSDNATTRTVLCNICANHVSSLRQTPKYHGHVHNRNERACGECHEGWNSTEVEEGEPGKVRCHFHNTCHAYLTDAEVKSLSRRDTYVRYQAKLNEGKFQQCMARCLGTDSPKEHFDRETTGRIFTCKSCNFQTCVDCNRPEHPNESCTDYQQRVLLAKSHVQAHSRSVDKWLRCPGCKIFVTLVGCNAHQCTACFHRFCGDCFIPWVGEGSAYLGGKRAHKKGCHYRTRESISRHTLRTRNHLDVGVLVEEDDVPVSPVDSMAEEENEPGNGTKRKAGDEGMDENGNAEEDKAAKKPKTAEAAVADVVAANASPPGVASAEAANADAVKAETEWTQMESVA